MRYRLRLAIAAAIGGLLTYVPTAFSGDALGSRAAPVEIVGEPMHHIRLVNSSVRVYEAIIPAGEATLFHVHRLNGVGVDMTAVRLEIEKIGAAPQAFDTIPGDIFPASAGEPYTHRVTNRGNIPYRSVVVERLTLPKAGMELPALLRDGHYKLELDNDSFRAYRVTLKPGEATSDVRLNSDTAMVAVSGGQLVWRTAGESTSLRSMAPGDVQWIAESTDISIGNSGVSDFVAVIVEFK